MLTLDQIKNVTFTKVRGGYATTEVDDFIDQCVDTVAGLIEERNTSNKKLEVLADKLVEYRSEEDSIRSVLLDARRMADSTLREASQKAALILEDARIKAEKTVADAQTKAKTEVESVSGEVDAEKAELVRLKQEVAAFKRRMLSIYKEHLSLIDVLPEEPVQPESLPKQRRRKSRKRQLKRRRKRLQKRSPSQRKSRLRSTSRRGNSPPLRRSRPRSSRRLTAGRKRRCL